MSLRCGIFIQNPGGFRGDGEWISVIWTTMPNILKHIQKLQKKNFSALTMEDVGLVNSSYMAISEIFK
jgi:hypothetical protein